MQQVGSLLVWIVLAFLLATWIALFARRLSPQKAGTLWGIVALPVLAFGLYLGLLWAPPDVLMGEVYRIMYVHFPSWIGTGAGYLTAFVCSLLYIRSRDQRFDSWASAGAEIGLVFNATGLITGSIWGRPTWGVWWTWDPRLTWTAIMAVTFAGYLVLRALMEDPEARARASSLVAIIGFATLPIVYFSVRWWRTLHQPQSSPETVDPQMVVALRTMMLAFLLIFGYLLTRRFALAQLRAEAELAALEPDELEMEAAGD
ncbi:MAG: cytochrome c biogenesis protein CcsA [Gemmatimonadota bacterium]